MANLLPLNIINQIVMDACQLNDDAFIPQFNEKGVMCFMINSEKMKNLVIFVNKYIITLKKNIENPLLVRYVGHSIFDRLSKGYRVSMNTKYHMYEGFDENDQDIMAIEQTHLVKTVEKNSVTYILFTTISHTDQDLIEFKDESGIVTTIPNGSKKIIYKSIEAINFIPSETSTVNIYTYEHEAKWVWNNDLRVMEFIVDVNK
jgi:hypothetical protein